MGGTGEGRGQGTLIPEREHGPVSKGDTLSPSEHPGRRVRPPGRGATCRGHPSSSSFPFGCIKAPLERQNSPPGAAAPVPVPVPVPAPAPASPRHGSEGGHPWLGSGDIADTSYCPTRPYAGTPVAACPRGSGGARPRWVGGTGWAWGHPARPLGPTPSLCAGASCGWTSSCGMWPSTSAPAGRAGSRTRTAATSTAPRYRPPAPRTLRRAGGSPAPNRPRPPSRAVPAARPSLRAEFYPLPADPSASFSCSRRGVYCANLPSLLPAAACDLAGPCPGTAGTTRLRGLAAAGRMTPSSSPRSPPAVPTRASR